MNKHLGSTFSQDSSKSHKLKLLRFIDVQNLKWSVSRGRMSVCKRDMLIGGKSESVFHREESPDICGKQYPVTN